MKRKNQGRLEQEIFDGIRQEYMAREYVVTVEIRSQHAKRGRSGFSGPDTYVAVLAIPKDKYHPGIVLNYGVILANGGRIWYCGQGYRQHNGPRSQLGQAIEQAKRKAKELRGDSCT